MVFEKVKKIIIECTGADDEDITTETDLNADLDMDSFDIVEMIMDIEEEFNIEIPDSEAEKFCTVGDIVEYIKENT